MSAKIPYNHMTEGARRKFYALQKVMQHMKAAHMAGGKVRKLSSHHALQLSAAGFKISADRLRKKFDAWRAHGDGVLIDLKLCGGSLIKRQRSASRIPARVVQLWHAERQRRADKDKDAAAWRWVLTRLMGGEELEGVGTWRALWFDLNPHADEPENCPWNFHRPPPGWSLASFRRQPAPTDMADALATQGFGKAKSIASRVSGVNIDWSSLRPMELVAFDDVRLDFSVIVWDNGRAQIVPVVLLVARDVATRRVLGVAVRPRTVDDDGTMKHIRRRDMQHLAAGVLFTHGLPRDYDVTFLVENSTATFMAEFEDVLGRATQGRVKVDKTGLFSKAVRLGGFFETGGAPNAKAIHESSFRLLHIELANVRGQMGRNYHVKHGEHDPRLMATMKLLRAPNAEALTNREGPPVLLPFPDIWEAHRELNLALRRIDARTKHDLEGFIETTGFCMSSGDPVFRPLHPALYAIQPPEIRRDIDEFLKLPAGFQNRLLEYGGPARKESPAQRWERLVFDTPFVKLSQASLFELFLDVSKPFEYNGANSVRLEILGQKIEFRGRDHELVAGLKYSARFNAENPRLIFIQDSVGRVLGTMDRSDRIHWHDVECRKAAMEDQAITLAHAVQEVQTLQMSHPDAMRELRDRNASLHLLNPTPAEAPKGGDEIAPTGDLSAVAARGARKARKTNKADEELMARMAEIGG